MASLWADYFREKGMLVVETNKGFMSAILSNGICLVDNFYVAPQYRGTRVAFRIVQEVVRQAEALGCTQFAAEVYKSDPMYAYIIRLHEHFGMSVIEDTEFKTTTCKRININVRPEIAIA